MADVGKKRKLNAVSAAAKPPAKRRKSPLIVIYTDGACKGNNRRDASTRRAGYGIFYGEGDARNVAKRLPGLQTNNRAEMQAIIEACERHASNDRIQIYTDSQHCKDVITKWMANWKRKGWKKADGKPPANLDMVKRLYAVLHTSMKHKPTFTWVKAHSVSVENKRADDLANEGAAMPRVQ